MVQKLLALFSSGAVAEAVGMDCVATHEINEWEPPGQVPAESFWVLLSLTWVTFRVSVSPVEGSGVPVSLSQDFLNTDAPPTPI